MGFPVLVQEISAHRNQTNQPLPTLCVHSGWDDLGPGYARTPHPMHPIYDDGPPPVCWCLFALIPSAPSSTSRSSFPGSIVAYSSAHDSGRHDSGIVGGARKIGIHSRLRVLTLLCPPFARFPLPMQPMYKYGPPPGPPPPAMGMSRAPPGAMYPVCRAYRCLCLPFTSCAEAPSAIHISTVLLHGSLSSFCECLCRLPGNVLWRWGRRKSQIIARSSRDVAPSKLVVLSVTMHLLNARVPFYFKNYRVGTHAAPCRGQGCLRRAQRRRLATAHRLA